MLLDGTVSSRSKYCFTLTGELCVHAVQIGSNEVMVEDTSDVKTSCLVYICIIA